MQLKKLFIGVPLVALILMLFACVSQSGKYQYSVKDLSSGNNPAISNTKPYPFACLTINDKLKELSVESFNLTEIRNYKEEKIIKYLLPKLPCQSIYSKRFKAQDNPEVTSLLLPDGKGEKERAFVSINKRSIVGQKIKTPIITLKEPGYKSALHSELERKELSVISSKRKNYSSKFSSTSKPKSTESKTTSSENKISSSLSPEREIFAKVNDRIEISYDGNGWIYTGFERENNRKDKKEKAIIFLNKKVTGNKSIFVFKPQELGIYILKFMNQDNKTGNSTYRYIKLKVVSDEEFEKILSSNEKGNENTNESTMLQGGISSEKSNGTEGKSENKNWEIIKSADYFFDNKDYTNALHLYLKNYTPENRYLNDRIAQIYFFQKSYEVAEKYWKRNLENNTKKYDTYYWRAIVGITKIAAVTNNIVTLIEYMDNFTHLGDSSGASGYSVDDYERDYCFIIKNLTGHKRYDIALHMGKSFLSRFPESLYMDEIYYYMGMIYENSEKYRDLEQALVYYKKIYNNYPASKFYFKAKERIDYIMRHFFYVR